MAAISLRGVSSAARDDGFAVRGVDLDVPVGVVCAVIGPSGSGKTTLLRLVAGLDEPAAGTIRLGEVDITDWPPRERDFAWFTQEHALYSHLDVEENIGFALKVRRLFRADLDERVHAEARAAGVERLLHRMPSTLSAGERQTAGLARATIRMPAAYLLDEPLARIDARERVRLRAELGRLFQDVHVPVLIATNDQTEALALGDRLAVLRDGLLVQAGDTRDVHDRPDTVFVATFVGDPGMSIVAGTLEAGGRSTFVRVGTAGVPLEHVPVPLRTRLDGQPVLLGIRPEHLRLGGADGPLAARVERVDALGAHRIVHARLEAADARVALRVGGVGRLGTGERVRLEVDATRAHLFDAQSGHALWHAVDDAAGAR